MYASIVVDASGDPHVAYFDPTTNSCKYAVRTGGAWTTDIVEAGTVYTYFRAPSIDLDSQGTPHISYTCSVAGDSLVIHAYKPGATWIQEIACDSIEIAINPSLVIDALDQEHIVYSRYDGVINLLHCWKSGLVWYTETVDQGDLQAVAIDHSGDFHTAYRGWDGLTLQEMRHARKTGTSWVLDTLLTIENPTGIAVDAFGKPHVLSRSGSALDYSWRSGGGWAHEAIGTTSLNSEISAIGIDWRGNPVVVFTDYMSSWIRWYYKWNQDTWYPDLIDIDGEVCVGTDPTLAFDRNGHPRVVYHQSGVLYYAEGTDSDVTGASSDTAPGIGIVLYQNFPNPFNPMTTIRFSLDSEETITLRIYDVSGSLVSTLINRRITPGVYSEVWQGKDANGQDLASGIYFYRLKAGDKAITKKMILLR
jgi:hypothetical protein